MLQGHEKATDKILRIKLGLPFPGILTHTKLGIFQDLHLPRYKSDLNIRTCLLNINTVVARG